MAALQAIDPRGCSLDYAAPNSISFHEPVTAERETRLTDVITFTFTVFWVYNELLAQILDCTVYTNDSISVEERKPYVYIIGTLSNRV